MSKRLSVLTNGLLKENPVLRLVLGTCPTLAVSTMASNGIGMGLAATFVLLCSNIVISALRKMIPDQVRIPCYITVIAGFVSVVQMLVKAYVPSLDSALDGIGMGIGFTITLTIMGSIREILGSGTWMSGLDGLLPFLPEGFAIRVIPESIDPFTIMTSAPGGFFVFGILMAAATWLTTPKAKKQKTVEAAEGGNA